MLVVQSLLCLAAAVFQVEVTKPTTFNQIDSIQEDADSMGLGKRSAIYDTMDYSVAGPRYIYNLGFGTPAQKGGLLFDTGSYATWVDTDAYNLSSSTTGTNSSKSFSATYIGMSVSGWWVDDKLTVADKVVMPFRFASCSSSLPYNGILGVSPIARDSSSANLSIINVLQSSGQIATRSFSVWMSSLSTGMITFGGIDHTKYIGRLFILPIWRRPGRDNDGFGLGVRRWYGYNETSGESTLVMEGLMKCGIDTGTSFSVVPSEMNNALAKAFNCIQAKNSPEALAAGYSANKWVIKYVGEAGYALDVQGVVLKVPMKYWLKDVKGNYLDGKAKVGQWYNWNVPVSTEYCNLGLKPFYEQYYIAADYDRMQVVLGIGNPNADPSVSDIEEIGTAGFAAMGATSAPVYSDTLTRASTAYYTATWDSNQPW